MKKLFRTSTAILLFLVGTFYSCNNEVAFDEPIDVPFTVFSLSAFQSSLPKTSWQWLSVSNVPLGGSEVIIINSDSELRCHIIFHREEYELPVIDFSKYTLLLMRGVCQPFITCFGSIKLQQLSSQDYVMEVNLPKGSSFAGALDNWHIAIIIDKLSENVRVKPNLIRFEDYCQCQFNILLDLPPIFD